MGDCRAFQGLSKKSFLTLEATYSWHFCIFSLHVMLMQVTERPENLIVSWFFVNYLIHRESSAFSPHIRAKLEGNISCNHSVNGNCVRELISKGKNSGLHMQAFQINLHIFVYRHQSHHIFDCRETGPWVFALNMAAVQPTGCCLTATEWAAAVTEQLTRGASGGTRSFIGMSDKCKKWELDWPRMSGIRLNNPEGVKRMPSSHFHRYDFFYLSNWKSFCLKRHIFFICIFFGLYTDPPARPRAWT